MMANLGTVPKYTGQGRPFLSVDKSQKFAILIE